MPTLDEYVTDLRDQINDPNRRFITQTQAARWVNRARKRIAAEAQAIRVLPPSSGSVVSPVTITAGGSGYTSATVTFSAPDAFGVGYVTATGTVTVAAGAVTAITVTNPGSGYITAPTITISGNGSGATATCTITDFVATVVGQEAYTFDSLNALVQDQVDGAGKIIGVQSIAVSWGATKPMLVQKSWTWIQAYGRSINVGLQNYPSVWAQYAQGENGSFYLFPVPAIVAPMDVDCFCTPLDLTYEDDSPADALPYPWTDAVQFLAAFYAYQNAQRAEDALRCEMQYKKFLRDNRKYVTPDGYQNIYAGFG